MATNGIGSSVKRKEDLRFITGSGRYTDDIQVPHQAYACFVRSPHAHATIESIDRSAAEAMPGVLGVFTGEEVAADGLGGLICGWMVKSKDGSPMKAGPHPILAHGKVRYVGDHVAVVVAETLQQARDAAEAVIVDYGVLPAAVDVAKTHDSGIEIHADIPNNLVYDWEIGDKAATDAAFAQAKHVTRVELINNRLVPNAMEPRAALGHYDAGQDAYTLYTTSQNPHVARLVISAFVGIAPEHKLTVIAPDVGGGFGSKIFIYAEECVCLWASKKVRRPVKWTADRTEAFLSDAHGRDHVSVAEMAMDENGQFLALRVNTKANMGAYLSTFSSCIPTYLYATLLAGQYKTPAIYCDVQAYYTNTAPVDAYRGAGRPEATYLLETLVEECAKDMRMDPAEIRRRNFIPKDAFPYQTPVALQYDTGDYEPCLDKALELADYAGFPERRRQSEAKGKLRGIGFSAYIEACGIAPSAVIGSLGAGVGLWESAKVRFSHTGKVQVLTGTHSHGQGHETTFAQLVASKLGVAYEDVDVIHGDTSKTTVGMGTYGSRSLAVGGEALVKACDKVIAKGKKIAAHLLEASEQDIVFQDGNFSVAGTDRSKSIGEIVFAALVPHNYPAGLEPGMEETAYYDPANFTYPSGVYICELEVDPDSGVVEIQKFTAVDDFGNVINPMIVEGQVHGGLAQGIGQALLENAVYDESGQLISASYMDYTMPRADDLPSFVVHTTAGTACTHNSLGVKGCGEAGAIGSPPAVMNAIADAIGTRISMPATPEKVWRALQKTQLAQAAE
ncbi:MAG TPA: xanthine dehydrogenase family protein molybdopterin-binding subunit [Geminicoccus sp.]|uniref:xanthine dehydrogenase family protein molybdopterin-binding subunit n=1 Tax=Geminicoccus sp. TaxID=2024832 RepID=UPI002C55101F|nr:xanthine dehydrogenase family protein molybdopterin-binding subunit [Geminicoccus sp.]HWL68361.1 xanthine dehydrogenase family protein molybdopterin-binding subunit [Geminicoccus sp.]